MEGWAHRLAAAVLNSTGFYALVNIMSFQTHNLLFSRQRAPKPQQLIATTTWTTTRWPFNRRNRESTYQSTRKVVHTSINMQGIMCGSYIEAVKPGNTQTRTNELSQVKSTYFQYQKTSLPEADIWQPVKLMKWIPIDKISVVNNHLEVMKVIFAFDTIMVRTTRQCKRRPFLPVWAAPRSFTYNWVMSFKRADIN